VFEGTIKIVTARTPSAKRDSKSGRLLQPKLKSAAAKKTSHKKAAKKAG
jgi:hypothetical protein